MESLREGSKTPPPIQFTNKDKSQLTNGQDDDIFEGTFRLSKFNIKMKTS